MVKTISVADGAKIELTFTAMSIEISRWDDDCPYDDVTIFDGNSQNGNKLTVSWKEYKGTFMLIM